MPTFSGRALNLSLSVGALLLAPRLAYAEDLPTAEAVPAQPTPSETTTTPAAAPAVASGKPEVVPSKAAQRKGSLDPKRSRTPPPGRTTFDIDPVADSAMIAVSLGFAGTLELINSTDEIRPQQIAPDFDRSQLVWLDRVATTQTPDPAGTTYSNLGLGLAAAFAVVDPIMSGIREKSVQTGLADAFMYAESVAFTLALTNLVKMAVRRPRPTAYMDAAAHPGDETYTNPETDSSLSFFSGHAAITATISATATYLAFARAPHTARPWITLVAGTALTTVVSIGRVRAGAHFPTDVIAGSIAGAGIGVVVPHLHRTDDIKQRRIWVGFAPAHDHKGERGGLLNVTGVF